MLFSLGVCEYLCACVKFTAVTVQSHYTRSMNIFMQIRDIVSYSVIVLTVLELRYLQRSIHSQLADA